MRVWDSTAEVRYLVLPERPAGIETMTEEQLTALVTPRFDNRGRPGACAMNGVHDMGGMHGLGPIAPEQNEPVFHAPWEGRVFALLPATLAWERWPGDAFRQEIERMPAADYLRALSRALLRKMAV